MTIKVFEAFSGVGSQAMALRNIGLDFEVVGISEVDRYGLLCYDKIHHNGEPVEEKTEEEMLAEMIKVNIGYNFSTGANELPKDYESIKQLYEAHIRSKNYGDIRYIQEEFLPNFDLFTYSFPCKNISVAGKQAGLGKNSNTQSSLLWECLRIISHVKPKYLLMENVKNLVGKNHIRDFKEWISKLEALGYNNYWSVLNGKNFGVAQNRERVMMVSILKEYDNGFSMPQGIPCSVVLEDIIEDEVDVTYYLNDIFIEKYSDKQKGIITHQAKTMVMVRQYEIDKEELRIFLVDHLNKSSYTKCSIAQALDLPYTLVEHWFRGSIRGFSIPLASHWYQLKELLNINVDKYDLAITSFIRREGVFEKAKRVYDVKGIAPTLTATTCNEKVLLRDGKIRHLTERETWRLQGFSDNDYDKVKDFIPSQRLYERAGRGIVVPMLEQIFKELFKEELVKQEVE